MATSTARIEANRRNAQLSTGPRTPEGKAISRRNSLKHGLTGEGIVVPDEDVAEVDRRFGALERELAPSGEMGLILVHRVALMSVRMERAARQEAAQLGEAMRAAPEAFDDRRLAEVEKLMDWLAAEPATHSRRLKRSPEGVDRLIRAWLDLDADLDHWDLSRWSYSQWQRLENLNGRRPEDFPVSRDGALSKAIWGDFGFLAPGELGAIDGVDRREWARDRLRERIGAAVAALRAHRETFDLLAIARDRAESARIALFDDSKPAILARKYEAAAERAMYRALKELREVEARAAAGIGPDATPEQEDDCEALASTSMGADAAPSPVALGVVEAGRRPSAEAIRRMRSGKGGRRPPG